MMCGLLVICILTGLLFKITPSGYVPDEDQGMYIISYNLPEGASSNRGMKQMEDFARKLGELPGVRYVMPINGFDILSNEPKASAGTIPVMICRNRSASGVPLRR